MMSSTNVKSKKSSISRQNQQPLDDDDDDDNDASGNNTVDRPSNGEVELKQKHEPKRPQQQSQLRSRGSKDSLSCDDNVSDDSTSDYGRHDGDDNDNDDDENDENVVFPAVTTTTTSAVSATTTRNRMIPFRPPILTSHDRSKSWPPTPSTTTDRKSRRLLYRRRTTTTAGVRERNGREGEEVTVEEQNEHPNNGRSYLKTLLRRRRAGQRYISKLRKVRNKDTGSVRVVSVDDGGIGGGLDRDATPSTRLDVCLEQTSATNIVAIPRPKPFSSEQRDVSSSGLLSDEEKERLKLTSSRLSLIEGTMNEFDTYLSAFPIGVRLYNLTFSVPVVELSNKIKNVYNSSFIYHAVKFFQRLRTGTFRTNSDVRYKRVLDNISLSLKPGRMYLVLGPPGSGKSSLLKAIAGRLHVKRKDLLTGVVTYNGREIDDHTDIHIENAISMIDQLDRHAPRYTVQETLNFAFQCKFRNGSHIDFRFTEDTPKNREVCRALDEAKHMVNATMKALGIDHVKDTFVGDGEIRGVSGGQRRRTTVGEMLMDNAPILCGDEISNGLAADSTYDIVSMLMHAGKIRKKLQVISLLQPAPETVACFDEIILLGEGQILFAGPVGQVEDYFASLGYQSPVRMDIGDFLQLIATPDGARLFNPPLEIAEIRSTPYTVAELAKEFQGSYFGRLIEREIDDAHEQVWGSAHGDLKKFDDVEYLDDRRYRSRYANTFLRSMWLNLRRQLTLWRRDKRVLIANAAKNMIMGISVGGVFFQTDDPVSILGVMFQGMLFVMLGGMITAPTFIDERMIFYKQTDANFYSALPFILGKAISKLPQTLMDCVNFGTILYYMVGLAPEANYYFTFMGIVFVFNVLMSELLFVFATFAVTKATVQIASACLVFFFMLFCGFIIAPDLIPNYYQWIYWYNPLAWAYRAVIVNEFRSSQYTGEEADSLLIFAGFTYAGGKPFGREWILWAFVFMLCHICVTLIASAIILSCIRVVGEAPPSFEAVEKAEIELRAHENGSPDSDRVIIPFKPITVSFEKVCYDVKTSTGGEDLRLLHNIYGYFKAGRMCALMGESGAGKTTLMDVIAMRKNKGIVSGDVRVNGFPQDGKTFRRCSGYVEQFDVQSPQLTVRETVLFSARLRLDGNTVTAEDKQKFSDMVLRILELTPLADSLVGTFDEGGLSFEQKKRLSIAVELAASPSILFLDEPTTGLDARSALLVVKLLRRIADQGRTVCATIHQPSSAVFALFDDLLLLKKGGHSIYFGELGVESDVLIKYFERHGTQRISLGDNPANWLMREYPKSKNDYADIYLGTPEYARLREQLARAKVDPPKELEITYISKFAVPAQERRRLVTERLQTVYWRSPTYNLSRLLVCIVIALILGSVFITERQLPILTETNMRAYFSVTFLSFIIIGILSITSVLPVMLAIRDVFYKHRAAGMTDSTALGWALGSAEKWFIILASALFCLFFLATAGTFPTSVVGSIKFWGFFTFNLAIYSYFGQAFMCLVPSMATAQILCSVFIGLNNFFSGLIVRPQFMTGLFAVTYWITPGHYVYEGLILSQYWDDSRQVIASQGSEFWDFLGCDELDDTNTAGECVGTVTQYVWVFFGGKFNNDNLLQVILVLSFMLLLARVFTFFALKRFQYTNT